MREGGTEGGCAVCTTAISLLCMSDPRTASRAQTERATLSEDVMMARLRAQGMDDDCFIASFGLQWDHVQRGCLDNPHEPREIFD